MNGLNVVLSRTYQENETLGGLYILDGQKYIWDCRCIELPWLNNQHNISCIPAGTYPVVKFVSPTKGNVFLLKDVPGRDKVEIHIGNYAAERKIDTIGCILPGTRFVDLNKDGILDVADSTKTMKKLWGILPDNFKIVII